MSLWSISLGSDKEHLEVLRDTYHFGEDRAGQREKDLIVRFEHDVSHAEVFLSGFNMFYTREEHDHEVMYERVNAWVTEVAPTQVDTKDPRAVKVKLMYHMADEDTSHSDDFNDCYIDYTVLAHTVG